MRPKSVSQFSSTLKILLADIDDTMTTDGKLLPAAYQALWDLKSAGIQVLPVTGRPAGWCDLVARLWPVCGIIGENGGFYFRYDTQNKKMIRRYAVSPSIQAKNQKKLQNLAKKILKKVPGSEISADQFSRQMDLAIDFCEDVKPLSREKIFKIKNLFEQAGAKAKISSIHVNGWYGNYDKLTQSLNFLKREFKISPAHAEKVCGFVGDSPNDEPLWTFFPNSFGVANVMDFKDQIQQMPNFITSRRGGLGFAELAKILIRNTR